MSTARPRRRYRRRAKRRAQFRGLRAVAAAFCGAGALAIAPPALAQQGDEGPIIIGEAPKFEGVHFEPVHFTLDFLARYERDTVNPLVGPTRHDDVDEYRGTLTADTSGFIGHPNLISFNLSGSFGLSQQYVRSDSANRHEDPLTTIDEYDVSVLLLKASKAPTTLYSRRSETFLDRQFGDSIRSVATETGAIVLLRSDVAPSSFHYFHREEDQTSEINPADFNLVQDTFEWETQWKPSANQTLTWDYTFDNVQESGDLRRSNSFMRHNALATHTLDFGPDNVNNLRSTLLLFSETGDFPLDRVRLDESLRLRHSPRFETQYDYAIDWTDRHDASQLFQRGSAGFRHKLFESLVSSGDIGASMLQTDPDDFTSQQVFADLGLDYTKQAPAGRITAGLNLSGTLQQDSERGSPIAIFDEAHAFGPSGLITLERQNIEPASIVITNATGILTFLPGVDYTLRAFPDRVEIRRVLGGSIAEGEVLLIDYRIGPEPASDTTTLGIGVTLRYDFEETFLKGVGLYARYFHQDQERDTRGGVGSGAIGALVPADVDDLIVGADYHLGNLSLLGERQMHDSTLSPYNATRFAGTYVQPLGLASSLTFTATYDDIERTEEDTRNTIATIGGRWLQRVGNHLNLGVGALWRTEHDSAGLDVQGFEQTLDVTWQYRQTTVYGSFRNSVLDSNADDTMFQTFQIGLRREF